MLSSEYDKKTNSNAYYELFIFCAKIRGVYDDITAAVLYDVIHDPVYRKSWDPTVIEGKEICRINECSDIGYYSSMYWTV